MTSVKATNAQLSRPAVRPRIATSVSHPDCPSRVTGARYASGAIRDARGRLWRLPGQAAPGCEGLRLAFLAPPSRGAFPDLAIKWAAYGREFPPVRAEAAPVAYTGTGAASREEGCGSGDVGAALLSLAGLFASPDGRRGRFALSDPSDRLRSWTLRSSALERRPR
jgi:hypothetical protein